MCSAQLLVTICHIFKLFSLLAWIRLSSGQIILYAEGCFQSLSYLFKFNGLDYQNWYILWGQVNNI